MKEERKKLLFISIVAFISFLIAFGKAFYEYGLNASIEGLTLAFLFPIFYFILTLVALFLMHNVAVEKRPYIVMSILSTGVMVVMWVVYFCALWVTKEDGVFSFSRELWYPIVLSILSLVMSICYITIIIDIIKLDNKIKYNNQSNYE